jgi:hypothetical protein
MVNFIDSDEVRLHLHLTGGDFVKSLSGSVRLTLLQASDYVKKYKDYNRVVSLWRRNRVLRLGNRCNAPVWLLSLAEIGLIIANDRFFGSNYVSDPRGPLSFSEVVLRGTRHKPLCVGRPPDPYQVRSSLTESSVFNEPRPVNYGKAAYLKPILRDRRGKPLRSKVRLLNRINALFYSIPLEGRRVKIPQWYSEVIGKPRYLFRIRGRDMSLTQRVVSTLCRVYYWYRFHHARELAGTARLIKLCRYDSIYRILAQPIGPGWYTMASIVYRRLKVLLKPLWA